MRFLQTSDWHLGKIFHERNLFQDQQFILEQIITQIKNAALEKKSYSAILIPGDIYDRAVPSPEATELLSMFIARMNTEFPQVHLFFLSGNHDSATRLSYGAKIFEKQNIHFCTDTKNITSPVILCDKNQKVAVYQIPFLQSGSIKNQSDDKPLRQQQEMYKEACLQILDAHKKNYPDLPSIICAHLYSIGCSISGSERSYVGTSEQVDVSLFQDFNYGAFGHIHKFQFCDKAHRIVYSGSPMPYNFDDNPETFMLDIEISSKEQLPVITKIPFNLLHPIIKLEGTFSEFLNQRKDEIKKYQDYYVQVTLTDEVLPTGAFLLLQNLIPNLLQLIIKGKNSAQNSSSLQERKIAIDSHNPEKIFNQFLSDLYSQEELEKEIVKEEKKLFIKEAKDVEFGENK